MKEIIIVTIALGNDGAERVLTELAKAWQRMSCKVYVIQTDRKRYGCEYALPDSVVKYDFIKKNSGRVFGILEDVFHIVKILKKHPHAWAISFLSASSLSLGIASLFTANKVIMSERNDPSRCPIGRYQQKLRNIAFLFADKCVFQTEMARSYFRKSIRGKGVIIPNPIRDSLPDVYEGEREKTIVTACRLHPQKNLKMLISAFDNIHKEFPDYHLVIYGQGVLLSELQEYVLSLHLEKSVFFPGFCDEIISAISKACMYVCSSDYEGISNSMLEAMAMGVPTIATDCPVGGARMMINNSENGILIPVGDSDALYNAMRRVITEPDFARRIAKRATELRETIPLEKVAARWLELML